MAATEPLRLRARFAAWLFALALLLPALACAAPRIGVATMQPGAIFWERFGHDAIVVVDPATSAATSYNFGFFDPGEPGFVGNFVHGLMRYQLAALPFDDDLRNYRDEGRGVRIQWLDLTDAQATALSQSLAVNARPENAVYTYDYFRDNCSTRVRDAIDRAVGGALRQQLVPRSHGSTYRSEAVRLASPATWMWLGFDIGLGPRADVPLSLWDESFVPMRLAAALDEVRIDGHPLVRGTVQVLAHRIAPEPADSSANLLIWLAAGVALGLALALGGRSAPRVVAAFGLLFWSLAGVTGALMLFIWLGTVHRFGWGSHNLLLLNPVAWLALPGGWRMLRGRSAGRLYNRALAVLLAIATLALIVAWLPFPPQDNARWIALLLPMHVGLFLGLRNRPAPSLRASP